MFSICNRMCHASSRQFSGHVLLNANMMHIFILFSLFFSRKKFYNFLKVFISVCKRVLHTDKSISESCYIKSNFTYAFLIVLAPNGIPFSVKLIG